MYINAIKGVRPISEVGFEPIPTFMDQNAHLFKVKRLLLESGALDHLTILTLLEFDFHSAPWNSSTVGILAMKLRAKSEALSFRALLCITTLLCMIKNMYLHSQRIPSLFYTIAGISMVCPKNMGYFFLPNCEVPIKANYFQ